MPETENSAYTIDLSWENRVIQLTYQPRRWKAIDHVTIRAQDGEAVPISETGFLSHYFGPFDPVLSVDEVAEMVKDWLDKEAQSPAWKSHVEKSKQLSLF